MDYSATVNIVFEHSPVANERMKEFKNCKIINVGGQYFTLQGSLGNEIVASIESIKDITISLSIN